MSEHSTKLPMQHMQSVQFSKWLLDVHVWVECWLWMLIVQFKICGNWMSNDFSISLKTTFIPPWSCLCNQCGIWTSSFFPLALKNLSLFLEMVAHQMHNECTIESVSLMCSICCGWLWETKDATFFGLLLLLLLFCGWRRQKENHVGLRAPVFERMVLNLRRLP